MGEKTSFGKRVPQALCVLCAVACLALSGCGSGEDALVLRQGDLTQPRPSGEEEPATGSDADKAGISGQGSGADKAGISGQGLDADKDGVPGQGSDAEGDGLPGQDAEGEEASRTDAAGEGNLGDGEPRITLDASGGEGGNAPPLEITISAAGDVTLGNYKDQAPGGTFREKYDQVEDKGYFFENVKSFFEEDDFTIVNLEGPLTLSEDYQPGKTYNMRGDPEYVNLLTLGSIEAVSMGNNHRLDYKEAGSRDTVEALEGAGIVYAYDSNIGIYETQGIRIGFISVNEVSGGAGVEKYLKEGIAGLKEEGVELILACCHWGTERDNYPEDYQKQLGRKCIDWGADLVLGHHPHVLQGIDQYQGKYIVYSLGNFCFGGNRNPSDKDTMIFQQTFSFAEDGTALPGEAKVIPCSVSSVSSRNDYRPTPLEGEDYNRVLERIRQYSEAFSVQVDESGVLSCAEG